MTYLINTITAWDEIPRARHQLARALAKNYKVCFVARNEFGVPRLRQTVVDRNLIVITPYFPIDYRIRYRAPVINEIYQIWLFRKLSTSFKKVRVINFDHTATQIFRYFDDVIYYCNDEYLKLYLARSRVALKYHSLTEKIVIKQSRFCIGVSAYLMEKLAVYNPLTYFLAPGSTMKLSWNEIYGDTDRGPRETIVLVSNLHDQIRWDWIKALAESSPDTTIKIVGPNEVPYKRLCRRQPNIIFTGKKFGDELFNIVKRCSACIIPFVENMNTLKVVSAPNKLWLYLSFGKPVVSSYIPNMILDDKFVYQSRNKEEFLENVKLAIEEDNDYLRKRRIGYAQENSWDNRIKELLKLYERHSKGHAQ